MSTQAILVPDPLRKAVKIVEGKPEAVVTSPAMRWGAQVSCVLLVELARLPVVGLAGRSTTRTPKF